MRANNNNSAASPSSSGIPSITPAGYQALNPGDESSPPTTTTSNNNNNAFRIKLSSAIRLILVDSETESRLLGCVLCGPSFILSQGDIPSALLNGLGFSDITPSQLSILSMNPNEATIGLRSHNQTEQVYTSEAKVVFIERDSNDPKGGLMEGLVLVEDSSPAIINRTTEQEPLGGTARPVSTVSEASTFAPVKQPQQQAAKEKRFRCVYARSDELGIFWYKSRSEFLTKGKILGGFAFADLVAMRQCSEVFEFDRPDLSTSFDSSIEFVLRNGPPVVFAPSFPFPLVQWLYCVHASIRLPRMSINVSQSSNWSCALEGDGFSLSSSPLFVDVFRVSIDSKTIGMSLTRGCGGTIIDALDSSIRRNVRRLDERQHASNYSNKSIEGAIRSREASVVAANGRNRAISAANISAATSGSSPSSANRSTYSLLASMRDHHDLSRTDFGHHENGDNELSIRSGDLILKVDSHWTMDWDWREIQKLLTELSEKRPLEMLIARCESLDSLANAPHVILRAKQIQLLLSSSALFGSKLPEVSRSKSTMSVASPRPATSSVALKVSTSHRPILEFDSRDARRRAATRQLLRRQTARIQGGDFGPLGGTPLTRKVPAGSDASAPSTLVGMDSESARSLTQSPTNVDSSDQGQKAVIAADRIGWTLLKGSGAGWNLPSALAKSKSAAASPSPRRNKGISVASKLRKEDDRDGTNEDGSSSSSSQRMSPNVGRASSNTGLTPLLDMLTKSDNATKREDAAELLLSLTNDHINKRTTGPVCIGALIAGCGDSSPLVQERCAGALWNLSDERENALLIAGQGGVQALTRLLHVGNEFAQEEACGVLWTIAEDEANVPLIILSGALLPLISILNSDSNDNSFLEENASGCVWTLSTSPSARKLLREDARTLYSMSRLLREGSSVSKENALGVLANLFSVEEDDQIRKEFMHRKGAQRLVQAVMFGRSDPVKRNATTCIIELARNRPGISLELASEGAITALLKFLLQTQENASKIKAAEALKVLAEVPENALQLSELGSVPEVLRMLEQAQSSRKGRKVQEEEEYDTLKVRASVVPDANFHPEDILTPKRYVHFDSAVLDAGFDKMVASLNRLDHSNDNNKSDPSSSSSETPLVVDDQQVQKHEQEQGVDPSSSPNKDDPETQARRRSIRF